MPNVHQVISKLLLEQGTRERKQCSDGAGCGSHLLCFSKENIKNINVQVDFYIDQ
jgi:hypothetical protein